MDNGTATATLPTRVGNKRVARPDDGVDARLLARFIDQHDERAFAAIVKRHGPMVLGVCRRVLGDIHAAEDAFQATFLVLVRRAGSIARPERLGNWLYGVAYRTAIRARHNAARRSLCERQAVPMPAGEPLQEVAWRELKTVLDEEMNCLPEKYRAPLVLCYLQGRTNEEAARQLGCPMGSMSGRLSRGRELLRKRLTRRGLLLSAAFLGALLSPARASAVVPAALAHSTTHAALVYAAAKAAVPLGVSARVIELVNQTLHALWAHQLKRVAGLAITLVLMSTAGSVLAYESLAPRQPADASSKAAATPAATTGDPGGADPPGGMPMGPCGLMKQFM